MKSASPIGWQLLTIPFAAIAATIVLLLVWVALAAFGGEGLGGAPYPRPAAEPAARGLSAGESVTAAARRPIAASAAGTQSAEERLAASADLMDFIESIRRQPMPGGHYLALKAYDFCTREARQTLEALFGDDDGAGRSPVVDGRQLDAQAKLARLCGGFRQRRFAGLDFHLLAEEGLQLGDERLLVGRRLERLSAQWDGASRDEGPARQHLIADVLSRGDAWLLRDLAGEFEVILPSGQLTIGGEVVSQSEGADVIDALRIMACQGHAGDVACVREDEWRRLLTCASAGECAPGASLNHSNALRWRNRIHQALLSGKVIDVVPMVEQRY